ncbi:BEL1-like homeodomain protein 2 [Bidens hawaiensis]|uniref:BEL1-like homeodomain protein 2 n=1 Tax=Bidens hawaiensis TaxID=980011 RepID=UPI004049831F
MYRYAASSKRKVVLNSMSQDYIFSLSHDFERPASQDPQQQNNQIPRDSLRMQGFELPPASLVGLEDEGTSGMLSEMFNFPTVGQKENPNQQVGDWYGKSAEAMQLFVMNPSPSSDQCSSSTLHMLLPNTDVPSSNPTLHQQQSHGLSLSLASSIQHLEVAKVEDLRIGDDPATGMLCFNQRDPYQDMQLQGAVGGVISPTHSPIYVGYGSSSLGVVKALRTSRYVKAVQDLLGEFCSVGRGELKMNKSGNRETNQNPTNGEDYGGGASSSLFKDVTPLSSAERIEHQRRKSKLLALLDEVDRRYNHYCEQMQIVVNSFDSVLGFGAAVPYTSLAQKAMSRHFRCLKDAIAAQLKHSCKLLGEKDVSTSGVTKGETPRLKLLDQSLRQQRTFHQMGVMEPESWRPQRGLPERSASILRAWLFEHFLNPYPSDADKHMLARQTGLSRNQISNWFINARVRLWKPMVEEMYQQESKEEAENHNHSPRHHQDEDQNNDNNNNNQEQEDKETPKSQNYINNNKTNNSQVTPPPLTSATHVKKSEINDYENDSSMFAMNAEYCFSETQAAAMYSDISNTTGGSTSTVAPQPYDGDSCQRSSMLAAECRTTTGDDDAADMIGSRLITFGTTSGDVSLTLGLHHAGNLPDKVPFFS